MTRRPDVRMVTAEMLREHPLPAPGQDKHSRGELVVVGGGTDTPGAVLLAGRAALRAGAGKLRIATVGSTAVAVAVAVPEAAVRALPEQDGEISPHAVEQVLAAVEGADAALVGPGLGDVDAAVALMTGLVPRLRPAVVVDALGSAYLTDNPTGLSHLEGRAVLTVNPTELALVAGRDGDDVAADPVPAALEVAARSRVVVLCGGTDKHVADPDGRHWLVPGGGPGLGVSGSGDVQAGIVCGLLARGADPVWAALWAAHLHARAGERLAASVGELGFLAGELPGEVPALLSEAARG